MKKLLNTIFSALKDRSKKPKKHNLPPNPGSTENEKIVKQSAYPKIQ